MRFLAAKEIDGAVLADELSPRGSRIPPARLWVGIRYLAADAPEMAESCFREAVAAGKLGGIGDYLSSAYLSKLEREEGWLPIANRRAGE